MDSLENQLMDQVYQPHMELFREQARAQIFGYGLPTVPFGHCGL